MSDPELESLVRSRFDQYVRVAWLVCGDRARAAEAVTAGFTSLVGRTSPQEADVRKAVVRAALKARTPSAPTKDSPGSPLTRGRPELAALVAVDWADVGNTQAARLMKLSGSDFAALYSVAVSHVRSHHDESHKKAVARTVEALGKDLQSESWGARSALLAQLRDQETKRRRWVPWVAGVSALVFAVAVAVWMVRDEPPRSSAAPPKKGDAAAPTSLESLDEVAQWAVASCKRPGGDYDPFGPKDVTAKLEARSEVELSGPMTAIDDQMVSLVLTSPVNDIARFCFAVTHGESPFIVDWYVLEMTTEQVRDVVTIKPRDVGFLVVVGGDETTPFIGNKKPKVVCPEAPATTQTVVEVSALGAGLWQAACGIAPIPDEGSMSVIPGSPDEPVQEFQLDDFTEVPLTQILHVTS